MRKRNKLLVTLLAALVLTSYWWLPLVVFDTSTPAYDVFSDVNGNGKRVAWGPRPRAFGIVLIRGLERTQFDGYEWQFRLFRGYCRRWVQKHGYELPE